MVKKLAETVKCDDLNDNFERFSSTDGVKRTFNPFTPPTNLLPSMYEQDLE